MFMIPEQESWEGMAKFLAMPGIDPKTSQVGYECLFWYTMGLALYQG